jgi:hypothetical protein
MRTGSAPEERGDDTANLLVMALTDLAQIVAVQLFEFEREIAADSVLFHLQPSTGTLKSECILPAAW